MSINNKKDNVLLDFTAFRSKNKGNRVGFGMIEVLISSMILVLVVGAVVALGSTSVRGGLTASDKTTAYNLVQQCLEKARQVRNTDWQNGVAWEDTKLTNNILGGYDECTNATIGTPQVTYNRTVKVTDITNTATVPAATMKKIAVTVNWTSERGPLSVTGSTYLTDWKQIN